MKLIHFFFAIAFWVLAAVPALAHEDADGALPCDPMAPQQALNICAHEEYLKADKDLNTVYKRARDAAKNTDLNLDENARGAADALLKAQRAWIVYRDNHCAGEGFAARGGTLEPFLVGSCLYSETRARIKALETLIDTTAF